MNTKVRPLKIAVIAGEESGDVLGADLIRAMSQQTGQRVDLVGVGGQQLQALGLKTLFDPEVISIMGIGAVIRDLPRLFLNIGRTAKAIAAAKPDCLITIDSPAFNLRVAKKVRKLDPSIPIIKYVCPSVWAWGAWRAKRMAAYTDHVLCLLPFEPQELQRLQGPAGTYVGHRLTHDEGLKRAASCQASRSETTSEETKIIVVLPGSRKSEVTSLSQSFGDTLGVLSRRTGHFHVLVPTIERIEGLVRSQVKDWPVNAKVVVGDNEKWEAFGKADAALAASGTVTLELALVGVPFVSAYKPDLLWRAFFRLIHIWTASLPNIIADRVIVTECFNELVRPDWLARKLELLISDTHDRAAQLAGFAIVRDRMKTDRPAGEVAAEVVLGFIRKRKA